MTEPPLEPDEIEIPDDDYDFDPPWLNQFLRALPLHNGNVRLALRAIGGKSSQLVYRYRLRDQAFRDAFDRVRADAKLPAIQQLEDELLERLLEGDVEVTVERLPGGQEIHRVKHLKRAAAIVHALERMHPEKWAPRELNPGGDGNAHVSFAFQMSDHEQPADVEAEDAEVTDLEPRQLPPAQETP